MDLPRMRRDDLCPQRILPDLRVQVALIHKLPDLKKTGQCKVQSRMKSNASIKCGSAIFRMIAGMAVIVMTVLVYLNRAEKLEGDPAPQSIIAGLDFQASPSQIKIGLACAALAGLLIFILGLVSLFKKSPVPPESSGIPGKSS